MALGLEREMQDPGHAFKPAPFWKENDPYLKGIEVASQIKSSFFAKFLADPRVAKWRAAHPDKGKQMQQIEAVYKVWIKKDAGAVAAVAAQVAKQKAAAKRFTFEQRFLAYANRWRFSSGADRVLKVFDALWPGAAWIDAAKTMPFSFIQSVPKQCYEVVSQIRPASYPKDLKGWTVTPPTLI